MRPIACTLSPDQLRDREQAWRLLMRRSLIWGDRIPGGLRLELHPGSADSLARLVELERERFPWITFKVSEATVEMTAVGNGEAALVALYGSPSAPRATRRRAPISLGRANTSSRN